MRPSAPVETGLEPVEMALAPEEQELRRALLASITDQDWTRARAGFGDEELADG